MSHFSPRTAAGVCKECKGVGKELKVNIPSLLDKDKTLENGGIKVWDSKTAKYYSNVIKAASTHYGFAFNEALPIKL